MYFQLVIYFHCQLLCNVITILQCNKHLCFRFTTFAKRNEELTEIATLNVQIQGYLTGWDLSIFFFVYLIYEL